MGRRFLNLLVNKLNGRSPAVNLHRIDLASLFCPAGLPKPAHPAAITKKASASGLAPARLPTATISFYQPYPPSQNGWMDFMALNDDIIAFDYESRTLLYDSTVGAFRVINPIIDPRCRSISLTVGNVFYVMARQSGLPCQGYHFQALSLKDWCWRRLHPLPINFLEIIQNPTHKNGLGLGEVDPFEFSAYAAVGQDIWISTVGAGTHSFSTSNGKWSKLGDWVLPFSGPAQYIAEHDLWFGFSRKDEHLCVANLVKEPPAPPLREFPFQQVWEEPHLSEAWTPMAASLMPLGSGKLCIARVFRTSKGGKDGKAESIVVLAGVEFVNDASTGRLVIIKHKSVSYIVGGNVFKLL